MKEIIVYQCDYCGRYKKTKKSVANHEKRCYWNPETRSCITCLYMPDYEQHTCKDGVDVTDRLKTQCDKYLCQEDYFERLGELGDEKHRTITHEEIIKSMKLSVESKNNINNFTRSTPF